MACYFGLLGVPGTFSQVWATLWNSGPFFLGLLGVPGILAVRPKITGIADMTCCGVATEPEDPKKVK